MKLIIVNPKGTYFDGDIEYAIIDGDNGQLGILENHTPIVVGVNEGFIKRVMNVPHKQVEIENWEIAKYITKEEYELLKEVML